MPYWGLIEPFALFFTMLLAIGFIAWVYRRVLMRYREAKLNLETAKRQYNLFLHDPDYQDALTEIEDLLQKAKNEATDGAL